MTTLVPVSLTLSTADRERMQRVTDHSNGGAQSVPALLAMLTDTSWAVRRAVVAALATLGEPAVNALLTVLQTQRDHEGRLAATVDALVASRGDPDARMIELTRSDFEAVVCDAIQVLGRRRAQSAVAVLTELTRHANDNVAVAAIEALGRIGGTAAVDALLASSQSGNFFRTFPAIDVLGRSHDPRAIPTLAKLTQDPLYAHEAARALGRIGNLDGLDPLLGMLASDGDAGVRVSALAIVDLSHRLWEHSGAAGELEARIRQVPSRQHVVRRVSQSVRSAEPAEQTALCRVLGMIGGEEAAESLLELLDGSPTLARAAAATLGTVGVAGSQRLRDELRVGDSARRAVLLPIVTASVQATEEVEACLSDADPVVRTLACEALARSTSPRAIPHLFDALGDPDARVSRAAASAIEVIGGDEAARRALEATRSPDPIVRRAGLDLVARFAPSGADKILVNAAKDEDESIRDAALQALPRFDSADARAALLAACTHPSDRTRGAAMRALGSIPLDDATRESLATGARDPRPWVRYYAAQSLGRAGDASTIDVLLERTADEAGQVRVAAIESLARIDDPRARDAVCNAAAGEDPEVRRAALRGLGAAPAAAAIPMLLRATGSPDALTRLVAVASLARFDDSGAMRALVSAARDTDDRVRRAAIEGLFGQRGDAATEVIGVLVDEPSLRERAMRELAEREAPIARVVLERIASEHPDAEVRSLAQASLAT